MRLRRGAVAFATLLVVAPGATPLAPVPASAATRASLFTIQNIQTTPIKVHGGYRMSISVQRYTDSAGTNTSLAIDISRREPTGDTNEYLRQAHAWGWQLPKSAFHLHRDLTHGWIDTADRMGAFGHMRMRFTASNQTPVDTGVCGNTYRTGTLQGNTPTAFVLRADSGYFGTIKAQSFKARVLQLVGCSAGGTGGGGGGGGGRCQTTPGVAAIVSDRPFFRGTQAPTRLRRPSASVGRSAQPDTLIRRALASPTPQQLAIFQRSPGGFNFLEFVSGQRHVAHVMVLFTPKPFMVGGVSVAATDLQIVPPPDTATWLGGSEAITGPGDPTASTRTCKGHVFRSLSDDAATTLAGGGGALTAHFDSVGDVTMQDGLSGIVQQVHRVS